MEEKTVAGVKWSVLIPSVVAVLAAIVLCASFFMPFLRLKDQSIVSNEEYVQDFESTQLSGIVTLNDLASISLVDFARINKALSDNVDQFYKVSSDSDPEVVAARKEAASKSKASNQDTFWLVVGTGALAAAALLFAVLRMAAPTALCALVNLVVYYLICWDFEWEYGTSSWWKSWFELAFGHTVLLWAAGVLVVAGILLFIAKRGAKRSAASA